MSHQLLISADLAPADLSELPVAGRVSTWLEMLDAGYKLVTAGLRREVGENGDLKAAYRDWYAKQMTEHDKAVEQMLRRMQQRR
jgi:hypothetical protein